MGEFFDQIVYSSANEDGRSELRALRPVAGDRLVTVASSGARAFELLLSDAEVDAIDFNPHQIRLVALKVAAWRALDHPALLAFLGVTPSRERSRIYSELRLSLSSDDRAYWDAEPIKIRDGILYCGVRTTATRSTGAGTASECPSRRRAPSPCARSCFRSARATTSCGSASERRLASLRRS